jgi:hypothetical protein
MAAAYRVWCDDGAERGLRDSEGGAMSDEQRTEEEAEVEGHSHRHSASDEPADEAEDEHDFEAHVRYDNIRME